MRKIAALFVLFLAVGGASFFLFKHWIVKEVFASTVRTLTGFGTTIQDLQLDFIKGRFRLEGLLLMNPPSTGFTGEIFAEAPEIYLEIDLAALFKKEKIHIRELKLDIDQLNIEKNGLGVSNISLLNPVKKAEREEKRGRTDRPGKKMPFQLDRLELTLRRISYHDRSGIVPKKLAVDMHINRQVFEGIRDPKAIINIIVMKVISAAPFGNLGIDPAAIKGQLTSTVKTARDLGERVFKETGTELVEKGEEVGASTREKASELWGRLKQKI